MTSATWFVAFKIYHLFGITITIFVIVKKFIQTNLDSCLKRQSFAEVSQQLSFTLSFTSIFFIISGAQLLLTVPLRSPKV